MEEKSANKKRLNYRITVVFKDEVIIDKYYRKDVAIDTIIELKALYPALFIGGALEERRRRWEVIWTLEK